MKAMEQLQAIGSAGAGGKQFNRLGTCEVCRVTEAKYTCPGCNLTSCSLDCVKKHKADQDCDGIRPRTRFSKMSSMTDFDIHQDYKLLEEINRTVQVSQQEEKKIANKCGPFIPKRLYHLKSHLLKVGTRILYLPQGFARHVKNRSYLNTWTNSVHWTLQLTFLNAEKLTIYEHKWPDNVPLTELLDKYLQASPTEVTPSAHTRLRCYREVDVNQVHVLLKADKVSEANKTFYRLDLEKTLSENLIGKTIVEFPQMFFVIEDFYRAKPVDMAQGTGKALKPRASGLRKNSSLLLSTESKQVEMESEDEVEDIEMQIENGNLPSLPITKYKDLILK